MDTRRSFLLRCIGTGASPLAGAALANNTGQVRLELPAALYEADEPAFDRLPELQGRLGLVNRALQNPPPPAASPSATPPSSAPVARDWSLRFNLHSYVVEHDGRLWCMWSDGPAEDEPTQEVRWCTSLDGLNWSPAQSLTGTPAAPAAFIARGFWKRNGELLALVAGFDGKGAFGAIETKKLRTIVFRLAGGSTPRWEPMGEMCRNCISNFEPVLLNDGQWLFSMRDSRYAVSALSGGKDELTSWARKTLTPGPRTKEFAPDEPVIYRLNDGRLVALMRNNGHVRRLFQSHSEDEGASWTPPVATGIPSAPSKFYVLRLSQGSYVLILNADSKVGRRAIHLALSRDGERFTRMVRLDVPSPPLRLEPSYIRSNLYMRSGTAGLQYPHAIQHRGNLLIVFSRAKVQIESLLIPVAELMPLLES